MLLRMRALLNSILDLTWERGRETPPPAAKFLASRIRRVERTNETRDRQRQSRSLGVGVGL